MLLRVKDTTWNLIGTRKVTITSEEKDLNVGDLVSVINNKRTVAAVIDAVDRGNKNTISLDKHLRDNLGIEIGQTVVVEKLSQIPEAKSVTVGVRSEAALAPDRVKALLEGSVVASGNKERYMVLDREVVITVAKTEPQGIVKITGDTRVEVSDSVLAGEGVAKVVYSDTSAAIQIATESPTTRFSDVGGLEGVKTLLTENIVYAIQKDKAELYEKIGFKPSRGIMLYGPPGTGKTLIARAVAGESGANFVYVPGSKFKNKYFGETERILRETFESAKKITPCIIFIDEIDAIAYRREDSKINIVNQLLTLMDEIRDFDVYVLGATNVITMIDPALLRPGRLVPVEVPAPDSVARRAIFKVHLKGMITGETDLQRLITSTEGFTGAQIEAVCNSAKMEAMRESGFAPDTKVGMKHLLRALDVKYQPEDSSLKEYT